MATKNDTQTLEVEVIRGQGGGVDVKATLENARKVAEAYRDEDQEATEAVVETVEKIINDPKYEKTRNLNPGVLAKMAVVMMGEFPTDRLCKEATARCSAYLAGRADEFLHIPAGRNSGFHRKDKYSTEELAKLTTAK